MLNPAINELMVKEAQLKEGDVVLEIGPGTGALTNALVNAGAHVFAIEKVVQEDFTRYHIEPQIMSFSDSVAPSLNYGQIAKVVSNLPFNIATDVLKLLLPMGDIFSHVVLLLQDEMALRVVGSSPGTSEYRQINIFVNFYSDPEYRFKVQRTNFFPQPNVDAAVVVFKLKQVVDYPHVASTKGFFSMVNSAFNGKRKMLRKSLQHLCASSDIESALRTLGLPETSRPAELEMDDFVRLYNLLANQ